MPELRPEEARLILLAYCAECDVRGCNMGRRRVTRMRKRPGTKRRNPQQRWVWCWNCGYARRLADALSSDRS